ncbi:MAG: amidase [Dehalococcoidia bacterium]|nr:amidase [Dehalococcoidia bacterium]
MRTRALLMGAAAAASLLLLACDDEEAATPAAPADTTAASTATAEAAAPAAAAASASAATPPADPYDVGPSTPAATATAAAPAATGAAPAAGGATHASSIRSFTLESFTVAAGTTVTWTNDDAPTPHTVTAADRSFDSGPVGAAPFSHTFATAGTFAYACKIHPSMTGTVTVQ